MKRSTIGFVLLFSVQVLLSGQENQNLFPNGDVENLLVNHIKLDRRHESRFRSHIEAEAKDNLPYWNLSDGATISKESHSGEHAIEMVRGEEDATATVFSDFFHVEDGDMPFGLPLAAEKEITVSFWYKTSGLKGKESFTALIKLGTIADLPASEIAMDLPASKGWKQVQREIRLTELKWGGEITFTLSGDGKKSGKVWIDEVYLGQQLDGVNLVRNHSFEKEERQGNLPADWQFPREDQWVGWVGARYRHPSVVSDEAVSGAQSLRGDVVYADGTGVAQLIHLNQQEIKPIVIELWSKINNAINSQGTYRLTGDNYANVTLFVYHHDGTMQEVSPMLSLDITDHDWDCRRMGFMAQKPVKKILLQITILGTEQTTSLWVDEVRAYELGSSPEALAARGVDFPSRSIRSTWGSDTASLAGSGIRASNDRENIYLTVTGRENAQEISIYLNPDIRISYDNHFRYLYHVIRIDAEGEVYKGTTIEKQGYTADGEFVPAADLGINRDLLENGYRITVPFKVLEMEGVSFHPFGLNVKWKSLGREVYWSGQSANNMEMGRLILSGPPGVRIRNITFGKRYEDEQDQSQDFVSHPQLYAGENQAKITLANEGAACQVKLEGGIKGEGSSSETLQLLADETREVILEYQAGLGRLTEFHVGLTVDGEQQHIHSFPIEVPEAVDMCLDQEFYYPEEDSVYVEVHNRYRPVPQQGELQVEVINLRDKRIVQQLKVQLKEGITTIPVDINHIAINSLPVMDHAVTVRYLDGDQRLLGEQTSRFGRINHTRRSPLPPIEKVWIDETGRLIINDDFRFFPVLASNHIMDFCETVDMGANVFKGQYYGDYKGVDSYADLENAWKRNAYTLFIGPYKPATLDTFRLDPRSPELISHPGTLGTYGHQFYYWKLTREWIDFRKDMERVMGQFSSPRLLIWGHHDSSFLYDRDVPPWPNNNHPPVGYCYVKIMSRPGLAWRNTPFQTKTEQMLDQGRFKLAEVNQYFSIHYDEVVPLHFSTPLSLRSDDWHGLRNEAYLNVIYGANGLYNWIVGQKHQTQRLRGWYQEVNHMWPIFVADDAENKVEILPVGSKLDAMLKVWQGKYYLIVANRDQQSKQATIRIEGIEAMKVEKLFELPGKMSVKGGDIADVWEKYDVHVYEIANVKNL